MAAVNTSPRKIRQLLKLFDKLELNPVETKQLQEKQDELQKYRESAAERKEHPTLYDINSLSTQRRIDILSEQGAEKWIKNAGTDKTGKVLPCKDFATARTWKLGKKGNEAVLKMEKSGLYYFGSAGVNPPPIPPFPGLEDSDDEEPAVEPATGPTNMLVSAEDDPLSGSDPEDNTSKGKGKGKGKTSKSKTSKGKTSKRKKKEKEEEEDGDSSS
jgi:hypothetical protein